MNKKTNRRSFIGRGAAVAGGGHGGGGSLPARRSASRPTSR